MSELGYGIQQEEQATSIFKAFLGYVLILCGVAIAFWVIFNVYGLFTDPAKLSPFQKLVSSNLEATVSTPNKEGVKVVIPSEIFSYFIPIVLLIIAAGIAGTLITNGVRLLDSDSQKLSRKITAMESNLQTRMDRIGHTLRKDG
jgi:hypothetical protein